MIYDISPPVSPSLAVFPGDTPLSRDVLLDIAHGDPLTLSTLRATVHLGSHVDAPSHYGEDAETIDEARLERFVGYCQVVRVAVGPGQAVRPEHLPAHLTAPRLLLATGSYPDPTVFNDDFSPLHPELIPWLAGHGVQLVGLDTPSVDRADSKELPTHRACLEHDVRILEGIVLENVPPGEYELVALPLRLVGFDASPVRAILRPLGGGASG